MRVNSATSYGLVGAGLIAMSYGLARFAFGLFVPAMRDDLGLSPAVMGNIGAMAFVSFVVASAVASLLVRGLGAAGAATLASTLGVAGLASISQAGNALVLGAGVFACGLCTGLMMPALTAGLRGAVPPLLHGRVGALMNAGTSFGVAVSVPTVLWLADAWRQTYVGFAIVATICVIASWLALPGRSASRAPADAVSSIRGGGRTPLVQLGLFAFAMGLVSSAYWIFAPDLVTTIGGLAPPLTGWLWFALGVAGLAGALASDAADRHGPALAQSVALVGMAVALGLLAVVPASLTLAIASAALFGIVYMSLTGIYLVTGMRLMPDRPASGSILPFLAIAVGQAVGSPITGQLVAALGYRPAFLAFALLGVITAACYPFFPERWPAESETADDSTTPESN